MTEEQLTFSQAMGDMLATWQLPRATGRTYGYLLLQSEATSFQEIGADLGLSPGAVSTSVRELVAWGLARTIPQPGSRRLLVEAAGGFEQLLAASHERSRAFIRTLRSGQALADDDRVATRLVDLTDLFEAYVEAGEQMLRRRHEAGG
ncbi:conserved hypothetical protein [Beutenbergia cavernae DSM 12333]|uniref:HTH marR-type domain-containing protein n=1 Tax=Beutenbergia cavernae (strain ATCC BAA-8 / DSM 12333 / CCUG 43141 / JCM 11478 / NBRC 16432 / NCIMB 13614 / HKI 0122) TaxID=471853 RepID=C5C6I1_BEUC1|nr:MarR family transcriptional regulator [Beutenbergia cavernae]ACQ80387.1 conserved hypothetical protein [Beutenbergia cavernae DSM 12333]